MSENTKDGPESTGGDAGSGGRLPDGIADLRFEDAIEQVEQIIERIESGEIGLESSIAQTERGMQLLQRCRSILDAAEQKISRLQLDQQGQLVDENGTPVGSGDEAADEAFDDPTLDAEWDDDSESGV